VLVPTELSLSITRLQRVFSVEAAGLTWGVALVTWFETVSKVDRLTGQRRVCEQSKGSFILLESIVHAAHLIPASDKAGQFFLNDLIDCDMYLRLQ
jgi:hypothetical protein